MKKGWFITFIILSSTEWICMIAALVLTEYWTSRILGLLFLPHIIISCFLIRPNDIFFSIFIIILSTYLKKKNKINTVTLVAITLSNILACIIAQPIIDSFISGLMSV